MRGTRATSNTDFGRIAGIHYTMASRIRNGHRTPSTGTLMRIIKGFGLTEHEQAAMLTALGAGSGTFSAWVRANLYSPDAIDEAAPATA